MGVNQAYWDLAWFLKANDHVTLSKALAFPGLDSFSENEQVILSDQNTGVSYI